MKSRKDQAKANPFSSPAQTLRALKSILSRTSHKPLKRFGQNFLYHPQALELFAREVAGLPCRDLLEIGSGPGLLTLYSSMFSLEKRIIAVEIDSRLAQASMDLIGDKWNVQVVIANGLTLLGVTSCVYSNTPYNMTSQIISVSAKSGVDSLLLGMQYELGKRVVARPGEADYGRLTVLAKLFFHVETRGFLRREWFYPVPRVNGVLVRFERVRRWEDWMDGLEEFTACLFSSRNKVADKIVARCTGLERERVRKLLGSSGRRVRDLEPEEILEVYRLWREGLV